MVLYVYSLALQPPNLLNSWSDIGKIEHLVMCVKLAIISPQTYGPGM